MGHKKVDTLTEWYWIVLLVFGLRFLDISTRDLTIDTYWDTTRDLTLTFTRGADYIRQRLPADDLRFGSVISWIRGFVDSWIRQGLVERHKFDLHVSFPLWLYKNKIK